nr:helix-turn-helix transcriptional regulator [Ectothiorhodospira variabilis]
MSRLMGERKLKISDVARDTGINRGTITRLYQETATRVDLEVVDALCRYFECEVGELFEYRAEEGPKASG